MKRLLLRAGMRVWGTLLPGHAAAWFERALLTPRRAGRSPLPAPGAEGAVRTVPTAAGRLAVRTFGTGPTVYLLHGWGGASHQMLGFVAPLVAAGFRVVAPDFPAHGASEGKRTNLVECTRALLDVAAADGEAHAIITHSFAGPVAANAIRHGLAAGRLAMLSPPGSIPDLSLEAADALGLPRRASERMLRRLGERLGVDWDDLTTHRLVSALDAPLLVVHDEGDRVIPWRDGDAVAHAAPHGRLVTTTGLGHVDLLRDRPVVETVVAFVRGDATGRRIA